MKLALVQTAEMKFSLDVVTDDLKTLHSLPLPAAVGRWVTASGGEADS